MSRTLVKAKLRDGETLVAKVVDFDDDDEYVGLELKDGQSVRMKNFPALINAMEVSKEDEPILEITREGSEYSIFELSDWSDGEKEK